MDYPFVNCLHPKTVTNKYTGDVLTVPCGICSACALNRSRKMSLLCSLEEQDYKYCYFVTLTYAPAFLPMLEVDKYSTFDDLSEYHLIDMCDRNSTYGTKVGVFYSDKSMNYWTMFYNKLKLSYGCIPYANVRDLQLYIKRLRFKIDKKYNEKIRYYAVSEYGPKTFRPHFHILFFFNSEALSEVFIRYSRESWPYGRFDASLSRGKCSSYVAGYVNSTCTLPEFYSCSALRPKCLHSTYFALSFYKDKKRQIYEIPVERFIRQCRVVGSEYCEFMPWRSLTSYFFPRCKEYYCKSYGELYYSYTILRRCEIVYKTKDPKEIENEIIRRVYNICTGVEEMSVDSVETDILSYFVPNMSDFCCDVEHLVQLQRSIYSELRISRHFLYFCCDDADNCYCRHNMLKRIIDFYSRRDYINLVGMYNQMLEYLEVYPDGASSLDLFYNCKMDNVKLEKLSVYKEFRSKVIDDYNKSIKHKVLNDLNKIFV